MNGVFQKEPKETSSWPMLGVEFWHSARTLEGGKGPGLILYSSLPLTCRCSLCFARKGAGLRYRRHFRRGGQGGQRAS